jgi:hypothetical protein
VPHEPGQEAANGSQPGRRQTPAFPLDRREPAEDFGLSERRIATAQRIATRAQARVAANSHAFGHAVHKTAAFPEKDHDVSHDDLGGRAAAKGEQVAREQRGEHARASHAEAQALAALEKVGGQFEVSPILGGGIHFGTRDSAKKPF